MSRQLSDWLEHYMLFTQNTECPTLYNLWSGITAISSALRRKCFCNWGLRGYIYPNFYIALVGPPGGRKGTAMKIAKPMVHALEIPIGSDSLGSTQALYKEIMESQTEFQTSGGIPKTHKSLSIWSEEFQVFLSERDPTLVASLTDLFDCADTWKYSTVKRGVEDISNCWLTIIGAITPSLLQSKLSQDAVGGGLLSRIIFVVGYGARKKIAMQFLSKEDLVLQEKLTQELQRIALLAGPFKLKRDFLTSYIDWYENYSSSEGVSNDKFLGYNARRALHLNKLCMIVSASESDDMEIHAHHFKKSLAILEATEQEMPNAFQGFGLANHAQVYAKLVRFIESSKGFTYEELISNFAIDALPHELLEYMKIAEASGLVKREDSHTTVKFTPRTRRKKKVTQAYLEKTVYKLML